jgi:hypothetical protein
MESSSNTHTASPTEPKSGVEIHWQSSIGSSTDANTYLCMNEFGADVFLMPMRKNFQQQILVDDPKVVG